MQPGFYMPVSRQAHAITPSPPEKQPPKPRMLATLTAMPTSEVAEAARAGTCSATALTT